MPLCTIFTINKFKKAKLDHFLKYWYSSIANINNIITVDAVSRVLPFPPVVTSNMSEIILPVFNIEVIPKEKAAGRGTEISSQSEDSKKLMLLWLYSIFAW